MSAKKQVESKAHKHEAPKTKVAEVSAKDDTKVEKSKIASNISVPENKVEELVKEKKETPKLKVEEVSPKDNTKVEKSKVVKSNPVVENKVAEVKIEKVENKEMPLPETKKEDLKEEAIREVESILFASSRRMSASEIAAVLPELSLIEVAAALKHLQDYYIRAGTSLIVENNENTWKLSLRKQYLPLVEKLMPSTELARPVIETLAILAWKAPMMQADLIKVRPISAYEHVGELERIGLIRRVKKGRSFEINLTEKFYDYFDLPKQAFQQVLEGYEDPIPVEKKKDGPLETDDQRRDRLILEIRKNQLNPEDIISKDKEYLHEFENRLTKIGEETTFIGGEVAKGKESLDKDLAEKANREASEKDSNLDAINTNPTPETAVVEEPKITTEEPVEEVKEDNKKEN